MPFHFNLENRTIKTSGNLADLLDMARNFKNYSSRASFLERINQAPGKENGNKSYADLFLPKDKIVVKNNLKINSTAPILQRKRLRSEYDGDFNQDNKFEIKPFDSSSRIPMARKIINLEVELGFHGGISANQIENFCKMIVGVISDLENKNYLVQVTATKHNRNASSCDKHLECRFEIKKPNQYVSQQDLLTVFSANFYRRCIHAVIILSCERAGLVDSSGLGQPKSFDQAVEITENKVRFNSMTGETQEEMLKEIYAKIS